MRKKIKDKEYVFCLTEMQYKNQCGNCNRNINFYDDKKMSLNWTNLLFCKAKKCPMFKTLRWKE